MQIQKPTSIRIFGIIAIIWGIWGIVTFCIYAKYVLHLSILANMGLSGPARWINNALSLRSIIGVLLIISGFGLIKIKPWARDSILFNMMLIIMSLITGVAIFGISSTQIHNYLISSIGIASFVWFFNRKTIKANFPYRKGLKISVLLLSILLIGEIVIFTKFWFRAGGHKWYKLEKVTYQLKDENFYKRNYFYSPFPFKYTLAIPKELDLQFLSHKKGVTYVFLTSQANNMITMNNPPIPNDLESIIKMLHYGNAYQLTKRIFSERFGLIFVIMRSLFMVSDVYQIEDVRIGDLTGFIEKSKDNGILTNQYFLFKDGTAIAEGIISGRENDRGLSQTQIGEIIASIKLQDESSKSANDFFKEGVALFNNQDYKRAKFLFASALCLEWENPEYQYYLGRTFFETNNWSSAKEHLKRAVSFQPNFPEAKNLLSEIESKQKKE